MKGLVNKLFLAVVLGMFAGMSQGVRADFDCNRSLLDNFSRDSKSFQIYSEEVSEAFDERAEYASKEAIHLLGQSLGCADDDEALNPVEISCHEMISGNPISKVCYAEGLNGFFFVSVDMMDNLNIVFNRWD